MLKNRWLNFVLSLTNKIYQQKREVLSSVGLSTIKIVLFLFFQEIVLAIVSLPLYIGLKPVKAVAYLEEKGSYDNISFDYDLRRKLTLTSVGVIFGIWLVKLLIIVATLTILGPLQLYDVSDLRPVNILKEESVIAEIKIQTAQISEKITIPKLISIDRLKGDDYRFHGTGQPDTTVVVLISDIQTAILTSNIDENGNWQVDLSRDNFKLCNGNHQVVVFSFDSEEYIRSKASPSQYFKVKTTLSDLFIKNIDVFINISIVIIIMISLLLTVLII